MSVSGCNSAVLGFGIMEYENVLLMAVLLDTLFPQLFTSNSDRLLGLGFGAIHGLQCLFCLPVSLLTRHYALDLLVPAALRQFFFHGSLREG